MSISELIKERIFSLSAGQRKVAEYILRDLNSFSYTTLNKISKDVGVSETTVIRLAYSLGFDSFSEMQKQIRAEILAEPQNDLSIDEETMPYCQQIMLKELSSVREWIPTADDATIRQMADRIIDAKKRIILGARSSNTAATWLASVLDRMLGNTCVVSSPYDGILASLLEGTPETVVICFSFARYARTTIDFARVAHAKNIKVISFTDKISAPIIEYSDHYMVVDTAIDEMGFNSYTGLYCLFKALIAQIRLLRKKEISKRLKGFEELINDFDGFYE